jgi:protein required for attachment to host cells
MKVRVVVADERQANFFDASKYGAPLSLRASLENPAGGKKDIDLETDRPGSRFGGASGARNGSGPQQAHHHGVDGERSTEQHELTLFAKEVAQKIDGDRLKRDFERLVIIAGPKMLGLLRQQLPETCKGVIVGEIPKDLAQRGEMAIRNALPREAFFH